MITVPASIPVLRWAAQREHLDDAYLLKNFPKWKLWLTGEAQPTLKQLEKFAKKTHTAFGYFFLPEPPTLTLPIPDFRTLRDETLREPSNDLLDTLYLCEQRQDWYRDYALVHGVDPLTFVGSANIQEAPETVAQRMRAELKISIEEQRKAHTWEEALRQLIEKVEDAGVMVMGNSIVGNSTRRKLNVEEFRGFALADERAPLIFLNQADSKAARMFTLIHELAHLWLGSDGTGMSNTSVSQVPKQPLERWCNNVAAEFLMPLEELQKVYQPDKSVPDAIQYLARQFKVSTLVALRRLFDTGFIDQAQFWQYYDEEIKKLKLRQPKKSDKPLLIPRHLIIGMRCGKHFAKAVIASTLEEQTLFRDALRMLATPKIATFYEVARKLKVIA